MSGFFLLVLLSIVTALIAIGVSKPSNRRYTGGNSHSSTYYTGDYNNSHNCDSFGGDFGGGDGGGCGGGD
jgi:hypothetical protein